MEAQAHKDIRTVILTRAGGAAFMATLAHGALLALTGVLFSASSPALAVPCSMLTGLMALPCAALTVRGCLCPRTGASSRMARLLAALSPWSLLFAAVHALCGGLTFWALHSLWARNPVDEGKLFTVLCGMWTGLAYRRKVDGETAITFPSIVRSKFVQIKEALRGEALAACREAFPSTFTFVPAYWILRGCVFSSETSWFPTWEPLRLSFAFSALFLCSRRWLRLFLRASCAEPHRFRAEDLPAALEDRRPLVRRLAARDLLALSLRRPAGRLELFSLSNPGGHPTNWRALSASCLRIVYSYSAEIEELTGDRVRPEVNPTATDRAPPVVRRFPMRNLVAPMSPFAVERPVPVGVVEQSMPFARFPAALASFRENLRRKPAVAYFFGDLGEVRLRAALEDGEAVALICRALAELAAASLTEDRHGVVQDTLGAIFASTLRLKRALDRLAKSGPVDRTGRGLRRDASAGSVSELRSTVRRGVYRMALAFGRLVEEIPLDESDLRSLRAFVDVREN